MLFRSQPAPDEKELAEGFGEGACDLLYVSYRKPQRKAKEASSSPEIPLLLIVYQHGRVDICVDLEKVEPVWHSNSVSRSYLMRSRIRTHNHPRSGSSSVGHLRVGRSGNRCNIAKLGKGTAGT